MSSFGERLRQEREARGIALDDIAKATKIGTRSLKALEEENFGILPGGIFNKGFVRAYARFVGLDEEKAVAEYQAASKEEPISVKVIADQNAKAKASRIMPRTRDRLLESGLIRSVGAVLLVIALISGVYISYRRGYLHSMKLPLVHRKASVEAGATKPQASTAAALPLATAPQAAASTPLPSVSSSTSSMPQGDTMPGAATQPPAGEFAISIRTSEESWLSVTADGKPAVQKLFEPNEQQTITARTRVQMVIGNPGGTELSLNGKPLPLGGDSDRPRRIAIGPSGLAPE